MRLFIVWQSYALRRRNFFIFRNLIFLHIRFCICCLIFLFGLLRCLFRVLFVDYIRVEAPSSIPVVLIMVAFRLSILLALTRIGSLLIIFPILVSATLVIRIRLIHGVDSWLIMEVVNVRFLVVRIHHAVFTAPMVYRLLPILVSSSV